MKSLLFALLIISFMSCSKSNDNNEDNARNLTVSVVDCNPPNITNHYWAVKLKLDKPATCTGNIIVQHDLWDLGAFKKTYIDTFDFKFNN